MSTPLDDLPLSELLSQLNGTALSQLIAEMFLLKRNQLPVPVPVLTMPWCRDEWSQLVRDGRAFYWQAATSVALLRNCISIWNPASSGLSLLIFGCQIFQLDGGAPVLVGTHDTELVSATSGSGGTPENAVAGGTAAAFPFSEATTDAANLTGGFFPIADNYLAERNNTVSGGMAESWELSPSGGLICEVPPGNGFAVQGFGAPFDGLGLAANIRCAAVPAKPPSERAANIAGLTAYP